MDKNLRKMNCDIANMETKLKALKSAKEAYERGISDIKASKKNIKGTDVFEIRRIMDQEGNKRFIQGFLKRMEAEKK